MLRPSIRRSGVRRANPCCAQLCARRIGLRYCREDTWAAGILVNQLAVSKSAAPNAALITRFSGRRQQPAAIRFTHWCNAVFIVLMAGSGLQILTAYPALGPRGAQYWWYPFQNIAPPRWLTVGGWLAGGRHW